MYGTIVAREYIEGAARSIMNGHNTITLRTDEPSLLETIADHLQSITVRTHHDGHAIDVTIDTIRPLLEHTELIREPRPEAYWMQVHETKRANLSYAIRLHEQGHTLGFIERGEPTTYVHRYAPVGWQRAIELSDSIADTDRRVIIAYDLHVEDIERFGDSRRVLIDAHHYPDGEDALVALKTHVLAHEKWSEDLLDSFVRSAYYGKLRSTITAWRSER